jgi:hypothetical protein
MTILVTFATMEYNSQRVPLIMREYGRHIQKMIDHIVTIEDDDMRQAQTMGVIELMGFLNPHLKNVEDFRHKLWDHLFLVSDFKLKVKSPYPIPTRESLSEKPAPLPYPKRYPKYSHLGKNLEVVIKKALEEENPDKRAGFANCIAYYMKLAYGNWHKEAAQDDQIRAELNNITGGQLEFTNTPAVKVFREREREDNRFMKRNKGNFQNRGGGGGNNRNQRDNNNKNRGGQQKFKKRFK